MSLFVEVESVDKNCKVIINLDMVMEIAPLVEGGCALFFPDSAAVGGKASMKVKNDYDQFKQFVLQTVSSDDIAKVTNRIKQDRKEKAPISDLNIPTL